jgi:hypothetical protein
VKFIKSWEVKWFENGMKEEDLLKNLDWRDHNVINRIKN